MRPRRMPSPALVVAVLALVVALGGVSYAAIKLPKNSVGSKQIKKDAVNSAKVKNNSLKAVDFKPGQLPAGPKGDQGDPGQQGIQGNPGPPGMSGYQRVEVQVAVSSTATQSETADCPAGKVVLGGGARVYQGAGGAFIDEAYPDTNNSFFAETRTVGGASVNHGLYVYAVCAELQP